MDDRGESTDLKQDQFLESRFKLNSHANESDLTQVSKSNLDSNSKSFLAFGLDKPLDFDSMIKLREIEENQKENDHRRKLELIKLEQKEKDNDHKRNLELIKLEQEKKENDCKTDQVIKDSIYDRNVKLLTKIASFTAGFLMMSGGLFMILDENSLNDDLADVVLFAGAGTFGITAVNSLQGGRSE